MSKQVKRPNKREPNVIPPAGMRPDSRRSTTGAPQPDRESLLEELEWRKTQRH